MKKERETANKYRQQALEGDLMAMNNMGVCYAQGIGVVEDHVMAFQWYIKAADSSNDIFGHFAFIGPEIADIIRNSCKYVKSAFQMRVTV